MRKYFILLIALTMFLSSCSNLKNIEVNDAKIESFKLVSASKSRAMLTVEVDNPSRKDIIVKHFEGEILRSGEAFADVVLLEEAVAPAKTVTAVPVKLEIILKNPLDALAMGLNFKSLDWDQFTVNAKATVKGGALKPTIKLNNVPLKSIVYYFK